MAHGVSEVLGEGSSVVKMVTSTTNKHQHQPQLGHLQLQPQPQVQQQSSQQQQQSLRKSVGVMGSRRIFAPSFKLKVLDSYRNDIDCRGNQRATARKYGIHRRQIQKWLQCEDNLRSCCAEGGNGSAVGTTIATPASSPQKDPLEPLRNLQQQQQHHQAQHNSAPASPALNLSLARLHGDELAVQQPPPPPPPPPPSAVAAAAQALATQQQHQHHHQANYRFHGAAAAAAATGYPDLKDKAPIQQQPQQQRYVAAQSAGGVDYSILEVYQPLATYRHPSPSNHHSYHGHRRYEQTADLPQRHQLPGNFQHAFEAKVESSTSTSSSISPSSSSSSSLQTEEESHRYHQERRCGSALLLAPTEIKTERASPDSAATPCETTVASTAHAAPPHVQSNAADTEKPQPRCFLKRERLDEDEQQRPPQPLEDREAAPCPTEYHRTRVLLGSHSVGSSLSSSPFSSHPDHAESLESLPPSPERSTASSSDSEMDYSLSGAHPASHDLARRRSFSLRFKLDVLDAFHRDAGVAGNQRATARKFGINRRQVQKWLGQETELRGVIELCGSNNRQRLGPLHEPGAGYPEETPVDLRLTTEPGQTSPGHFNCCDYASASPGAGYVDSSLTPPYSAPGCSLSCCQDPITPGGATQTYYCYSPSDLDSSASIKRPPCTQSCCYPDGPAPKKICLEENVIKSGDKEEQPVQETPLCLVKPKRPYDSDGQPIEPVSSTVPTPPTVAPIQQPPSSKKDAILFKPYLDNPVSKPSSDDSAANNNNNNNNNNNCQETCNLNERSSGHDLALELSFRLPVNWRTSQQQQPQQHHSPYLEFPQVRSAFVRYPMSAHYS